MVANWTLVVDTVLIIILQKDAVTRRLYVSNTYLSADPAHITFTEVQLPSVKPEQFYVVMATHESGAFIHVAAEPDKPSGALYVSDSSGSRYTLSLKNHLVGTTCDNS